ncbi:conserved hypothetical protein [Treponema primitia ZAS-2]|uniref:Nitrogenase/oxidoreductase component 1 domain-containing protein n=1 Tax=Treponema primitia (strain ATCC BAA-887 / DSM 12427 / ZAS-2) TaxID=545694 RepID=F5YIT6_TREPZ|nr:nitrogenase component 1 [Treponema primitia]AEF86322.1 conserved hypothetical protein [Treponema primitia ZAS-2]
MAQMLYSLPPLAPDYSGVASIFHDLGALTIIHDASGCTGTYTGYDEPRWFGSTSPTFSSGLRDMDAIMGEDEKLLEKIEAALKTTGAPWVVIVGSPVPMVVGFDFRGFASLIEHRLGVPAFGFPTNGLGYYDKGQRDAYLAIAGRFLKDAPVKNPRRVNILGASVLDGFDDATLDMMEGFLNDAGLELGAIWGARSGREALGDSGGAGANWVVSAAALPLARFLQTRFGTPFTMGFPVGKQESSRILSALSNYIDGKTVDPKNSIPDTSKQTSEAGTIIIGEPVFCSSLRVYLEDEYGGEPVRIGTFFEEGKELLGPGDCFFGGELEAEQFFAKPGLKRVIADPIIEDLLPGNASIEFIPLPHRAISGRIYEESRSLWALLATPTLVGKFPAQCKSLAVTDCLAVPG